MKMNPDSVQIYSVAFAERRDGLFSAYVTAKMCELANEWPSTIYDPKYEMTFAYEGNVPMKDWMVGNYSGFARYVQIPSQTTEHGK